MAKHPTTPATPGRRRRPEFRKWSTPKVRIIRRIHQRISQPTNTDRMTSPCAPATLSQRRESRIRATIRDVITDAPPPETEQQQPGEVISGEESELRELMESIAFEEGDVKGAVGLAELCEWLAEILKSDHWKLSERQKRMLGRPITLLMNSVGSRLQDYLPRFFAEWC